MTEKSMMLIGTYCIIVVFKFDMQRQHFLSLQIIESALFLINVFPAVLLVKSDMYYICIFQYKIELPYHAVFIDHSYKIFRVLLNFFLQVQLTT